MHIQGFVADFVTYRYYADSETSALYLMSILRRPGSKQCLCKSPWQTQGLQGEHDIAEKPL